MTPPSLPSAQLTVSHNMTNDYYLQRAIIMGLRHTLTHKSHKSHEELLMDMLEVQHFRAVAARRLSDGYEGAAILLAFALDYWHDAYTDARDYRSVWCGIVWC